jgi:hypothetical protein
MIEQGRAIRTGRDRIRLLSESARKYYLQQSREAREEEMLDRETRLHRGPILRWDWQPRWSGPVVVMQAVPKVRPPEDG